MFANVPRKSVAVLLALAASKPGGATYRFLRMALGTTRRNVRRSVVECEALGLVRVTSIGTGRGALAVVSLTSAGRALLASAEFAFLERHS